MGITNSKFDESQRKVKVVDPPQDAEKWGISENSKSDESRRKLNLVDPPQDAEKLGLSVRELLECPVCLDIMYPPIYQCSNGHPLCSNCKPKMKDLCPTCRQGLGNIRCLTLEKVAESLELPCKYQKLGCSDIFPYRNELKHESECSFRPYSCPKCSVLGGIPFLVSHLKDNHEGTLRNDSTIVQRFANNNPHGVKNSSWTPLVISCFEQHFYMHMEKFQLGEAWVYIAFLQLMGDDEEAKTYRYSLKFGDNERKMVWQGVPRSIRESHRKVRDSLDGLIIDKNLFFGGDKKLALDVTIKIWKGETRECVTCSSMF